MPQMYVIKNRGSGRVLDVERGGQVVNSPVLLFDKHGEDNQKWTFENNQICTAMKPAEMDLAINIHDRSTGQVIMSVCLKDPSQAKDQMWVRNDADGTIECMDDRTRVLSAGAGNQGDHLGVEQKGNPPPASQQWDWEAV